MRNHVMMKNTHLLGVNNYYPSEYKKTQIVVGNSYSEGLTHFTKWEMRMNGKYKKTAPFTILRDGTIYLHFDPKHHCDFVGIKDIDRHIIPIVLENNGWLKKDIDNNRFLNWIGDIYNEEVGVVEKKWRNHSYWMPYTDEQMNSLVRLCKYLCEKFDIPLEALSHNTKVEMVDDFEGIVYKSNYSKYFSDVSPAFDFNEFKNKLELK